MSNPMMDPERVAAARACLPDEDSRRVFDKLCAMYPEAALFWDEDWQTVTLERVGDTGDGGAEIRIS